MEGNLRKALFLSTSSNETTKYADSLECLGGWEVGWLRYDEKDVTDAALFSAAKGIAPELIVYIGSRWGKMPSTYALARLNDKVAPSVHLCSDGADVPWWDLLMEYYRAHAFSLQVTIDGAHQWPLANNPRGMSALTPINPSYFGGSIPHAERAWGCGYAGNPGSEGGQRRGVLTELAFQNLLRMRLRGSGADGYQECCDFIKQCRMTLNVSFTGTEAAHHVKGRVIEAALAGSCLLEVAVSPTCHWFTPGVDFLTYDSVEQAAGLIRDMAERPEATQAIGERLRARVAAEHSPRAFWSRIFDRVGLRAP